MTELMKRLVDAGYPKEEFFHHYSDLYIFATPLTQRVVNQWCKDNGYHRHLFVSTFRDQITGRRCTIARSSMRRGLTWRHCTEQN